MLNLRELRGAFISAVAVGATAFAACGMAHADLLTVSFSSASLDAAPGTILVVSGTVSNSSGEEIFLNGVDGVAFSPELLVDTSPFLTSAPVSLTDGSSFTGSLFAVVIGTLSAAGEYDGIFDIQGGADPYTFDYVATAPFTVSVAEPAPEPCPALLVGGYVTMLILMLRRKRTTAASRCRR